MPAPMAVLSMEGYANLTNNKQISETDKRHDGGFGIINSKPPFF